MRKTPELEDVLAVYAPLDANPTPDAFFMARSEDRLHGVTFVRDRLGEEGARNGRVYEVRAVVLVTRLEVCELAGLITVFGGPDTRRHGFSATFILSMKSASSVTHLHRAQLFAASPLSSRLQIVTVAAGISLLAVFLLLMQMLFISVRHAIRKSTDQVFPMTHLGTYVLSLLLSALVQGLGGAISIAWGSRRRINDGA